MTWLHFVQDKMTFKLELIVTNFHIKPLKLFVPKIRLNSESFKKLECVDKHFHIKWLNYWASVFPACFLPSTQRSTEAALGVRRSIRKTGKQTNKRAFWRGRREVSSQSKDWFDLIRKRIFFSRYLFRRRRTQAHLSKRSSMLIYLGKCWTKPFLEHFYLHFYHSTLLHIAYRRRLCTWCAYVICLSKWIMEQGTQKVREPKKEMAWSFFRWGTLPWVCMREKQEVCILIHEVTKIALRTQWTSPAVCGRNWTWVLVNKRERGKEECHGCRSAGPSEARRIEKERRLAEVKKENKTTPRRRRTSESILLN